MSTPRRKHGGGKRRKAVGANEPLRTCIACRAAEPKEGLLRFVRAPSGEVFFDVKAALPGRGAYTCPNEGCVHKAAERGAFRRAFDAAVLLPADLVAATRQVLTVEGLLGLGLLRRQGRLFPGRTEALKQLKSGEAGAVILAQDLTERSHKELAEAVAGRARIIQGPPKASMGVAMGRGPTGVVAVGKGPFVSRVVCNLQRLAGLGGSAIDAPSGAPCGSGVAGV
jgi:uncharacterized protein